MVQRRFDFGPSTVTQTSTAPAGCYDPIPQGDPHCEPTCQPCTPCCPAKVEKRNYINVKPSIARTWFRIGVDLCTAEVVQGATSCIELRVRSRGECHVHHVIHPTAARLDGSVCVDWPLAFWRLGDGWYEADVYVNGCTCLTIGLHVRGCHQYIQSVMHTTGLPCGNLAAAECALPIEDDCAPFNPVGGSCDPCTSTACNVESAFAPCAV
jgi:hypothetical protein